MSRQMRVVILLLVINFYLYAVQKIAISGKVTNSSGKPISGATISLKSNSLTTKTDEEGRYSLSGEISGVNTKIFPTSKEKLIFQDGVVRLTLLKSSQVNIKVFDMTGNLLKIVCQHPLEKGNHNFIIDYQTKNKLLIVCVSIDQTKYNFLYVPFYYWKGNDSYSISSLHNKHDAKIAAVLDTLIASANTYKTKHIPLSSYEDTIDIVLENEDMGNCIPSIVVNTNVSGSGPHKVVVETNSDAGIKEGTIYRPADIEPGKNYPIFVWGEGGCSQNGLSNSAAMAEIASYGYFVIADGTPNGSGSRSMNTSDIVSMGKPMLAYIGWAIAQNSKPCSPYYQSLDTTKIATNGFSCGGLMAEGTAGDKRITTWGITSSGMFSANQSFYKTVHTPVLIVEGGSSDMAYENGLRDYQNISALGIPIMFFSKDLGHGGDLFSKNGGDFTKIILAWLNWWLKGDEGPTGKGALVGSGCKYCSDKSWEVKSANIP